LNQKQLLRRSALNGLKLKQPLRPPLVLLPPLALFLLRKAPLNQKQLLRRSALNGLKLKQPLRPPLVVRFLLQSLATIL
jgi:hypothetical protein